MYLFNLTLYCLIALRSGCIHLYSHNYTFYSIFSSLVSDFLHLTNIMDIEWHLIMVLLGIYPITTEVECLLKCLLTILASSFLNCIAIVSLLHWLCLLIFMSFLMYFDYWTFKNNMHCNYPLSGFGLWFNFSFIVTFIDPKF